MSEPRFYILEHSGYIGVTAKTESTEFMVLDREYGHRVVFSRIAPVESMGPRFEQLRRAPGRSGSEVHRADRMGGERACLRVAHR